MTKNQRIVEVISFANNLKLNIFKKSDNFFTKEKDQNQSQNNNQICMICFDKKNEVILRPCGHSGLCFECFENYLKKSI